MRMTFRRGLLRGELIGVLAVLTALLLGLSACGGGSSSAGGGGGGSGGTIAGTVDNGIAAAYPSSGARPVLTALSDVVVARAEASGVAGVTVELLDGNGDVVGTQTTDASGSFMFTGLAPGTYSIRLSQGGSVLGESSSIEVDGSTKTSLKLALDGAVTSVEVEVEAEGDQISGQVEDEGTEDDGTSDDESADDDSNDDGAEDDNSGSGDDGDSNDDGEDENESEAESD